MKAFAIPLELNWRERGLWAHLDTVGPSSFEDLLAAGDIGKEGLRHLIKSLKKKGVVEIPRIRDDKNRFTSSKYRLTDIGKGLAEPLQLDAYTNITILRAAWDAHVAAAYPQADEEDAA